MKNTFTNTLAAVLLIISGSLVAQNVYWSNAVTITDTVSNNKNSTIKALDFFNEDIYIFWENSTDTNSTSIIYRSFYNEDEYSIFLNDEGVHYTKPQLIDVSDYNQYNDTSFYVFFQSDETGINKIYYSIFVDDSFTQPQLLNNSLVDQTNLLCSNEGRVVWMEQDRIMHKKLDKYTNTFDEVVVIDSGNVSFPSVSQIEMDWMWGFSFNTVAYIKSVNDSSRILTRSYDNENGWLEPLTIFTGKQCLNLSFCTGFGSPGILTWDYYNDTIWRIINYDMDNPQMFISEFELQSSSQPHFYSGIIFVKNRYLDIGISSFIYQSNDISDIFTVPFFMGVNGQLENYENVSNSDSEVNNPQILSGKIIDCNQYFINIWEEKVNNFWQLKYSTSFECLSDINDQEYDNKFMLFVSPNPIKHKTNISFELDRVANTELYIKNLSGVTIEILENNKLPLGKYVYRWDGSKYKSGIYFIRLSTDLGVVTKKIIITK